MTTHTIAIWVSFETDTPACHEYHGTENAAINNAAYEMFENVSPDTICHVTLVEYENGQPVHHANVKSDLISMMAEHTDHAAREASNWSEHCTIERSHIRGGMA